MSTPTDQEPPRFIRQDLRNARFVGCDLSGVVMRGVDLVGADIDTPNLRWGALLINGVDAVPLIEAELDRRFPGRELRRSATPDGLRAAWDALERRWAATLDRVAGMPAGTVDVSVDNEWTFAETLRHLVLVTNAWLHKAIERVAQPFHEYGVPFAEYESDGFDMSVFASEQPSYDEVLATRAAHVAMVGNFLTSVTAEVLAEPRANPWAPDHELTVVRCVHVILNEEWEHHRYAVRDLDTIAATAPRP